MLAEHRLERCLGAADRVIALRDGAVACDAPPAAFLEWAGEHAPELQTPGARLFSLAGLRPLPGEREGRPPALPVAAVDFGTAHGAANPTASVPEGASAPEGEVALALKGVVVRAQGRGGRAARRRPRRRAPASASR